MRSQQTVHGVRVDVLSGPWGQSRCALRWIKDADPLSGNELVLVTAPLPFLRLFSLAGIAEYSL